LLLSILAYHLGWSFIIKLIIVFIAAMAAIALLVWDETPRTKVILASMVIAAGFIFELIGVHTGALFGSFTFSGVLGFRILGVPFAIGVLWFLVTLAAWHIVNFGKLDTSSKFLLAGGLVVMVDLILEQFAYQYNLWAWRLGAVPFVNYLSWFILAEAIFYLYFRFIKTIKPSLYIAGTLPLLALFFWLMIVAHP
jgi:putative membrane protein